MLWLQVNKIHATGKNILLRLNINNIIESQINASRSIYHLILTSYQLKLHWNNSVYKTLRNKLSRRIYFWKDSNFFCFVANESTANPSVHNSWVELSVAPCRDRRALFSVHGTWLRHPPQQVHTILTHDNTQLRKPHITDLIQHSQWLIICLMELIARLTINTYI